MLEIINQFFAIEHKSKKEDLSLFNRNIDRIYHLKPIVYKIDQGETKLIQKGIVIVE